MRVFVIVIMVIGGILGYIAGLHLPLIGQALIVACLVSIYNYGNFRWWEGLSAIPYVLFAFLCTVGMFVGDMVYYFASVGESDFPNIGELLRNSLLP